MTRLLSLLLAGASVMLPAPHRARWREEALAVLLEARGLRRWHFALDTVLKAPILAWHHRRADPRRAARPPASGWAGAALFGVPVLMIGALALPPVVGEGAAEFLFLIAPCGMLPAVTARSFHDAARRGGGALRYAGAALLSSFAGSGPVAAGALAVATGAPALALAGAAVPGVWLICVNGAALARRQGPAPLTVLGVCAGVGLVGVLSGLQLSLLAPGPVGASLSMLSLALLAPTYPAWSVWSGIRLLRGDRELLTGR